MTLGSYGQFCPVAMAAEMLCTRWTVVLLRELIAGSTRFNDLRRGVPRMSPALLSQRLKELEAGGSSAERRRRREPGVYEYHLTKAGRDSSRWSRLSASGVSAGWRAELSLAASRPAAADVGHAAQSRPDPDAEAAHHIQFQFPNCRRHSALGGWL